MKTNNSSRITKYLLVLGVFGITTFITYGAAITSGGMFKSTPYQSRNTTADATLSRLTNGSGAIILDGVVAKVKAKATEKGGNPLSVSAYNAYIDTYLNGVDKLDNETRTALGSDYEFIFQYIYPRVYELKQGNSAFTSISNSLSDMVGASDNKNTGSVSTGVSTGSVSTGTSTGATGVEATASTPKDNSTTEESTEVVPYSATDTFYVG